MSSGNITVEIKGSATAHAAPTGLLCDLLAYPERAKIQTNRPTFGWIVGAGCQSAYQVRVHSVTGDLQEVLWDSGVVTSSCSINILYGGRPLCAGDNYSWTVRTWGWGIGPSEWANPQKFFISEGVGKQNLDEVSGYSLEMVRVAPKSKNKIGPNLWTLDFGRQAFGWLEIEIESHLDNVEIVVRLGEAWRDGALDRSPPGSVRYAEISINAKAGRHIYRAETPVDSRNTGPAAIKLPAELGVILPFRYVEIEARRDVANQVSLVAAVMTRVQYPFDEAAADFTSSDPVLNRLWELCRYTIQATSFAGYYVDGDRERIPYEADAYINQLSHYAVDREYSLARRTHEYLLEHSTWPTEWKQHSILIAWADFEATGDARSLRRCYATLKNEKLLLRYARNDGLLETGQLRDPALGRSDVGDLVDWPPGERDEFDFRRVNTVVNAFHYRTLILMEKIAAVLSHAADQRYFTEEARRIYRNFNDRLFDKTRGVYVDGEGSDHASQHANLFPLAFGLVPEGRRATVVSHVKERGMACSVYPAQFLLEGLFEAREAEHAVALMTGGGLRSWRNMLDHGATITWEAWDQSLKPNQDWNHAWGAAPGNIIARYVLGVRPLEPGYGRVLIDPQLGELTEVSGVVPTIRGPIRVRAWRNAEGRVCCEAQAPANVTCEYRDVALSERASEHRKTRS